MAANPVKSSVSDSDPRSAQVSPKPGQQQQQQQRDQSRSDTLEGSDLEDDLQGVFSPVVAGPSVDDYLETLTRAGRPRSPKPTQQQQQQQQARTANKSRSPSPAGRRGAEPQRAQYQQQARSSYTDSVTRSDTSSIVITRGGRPAAAPVPALSPVRPPANGHTARVNNALANEQPPRVFEAMNSPRAATMSLTELFEDYEATIYEAGPLGMRMIKIKELSSVTGTIFIRTKASHLTCAKFSMTGSSIEWGQIQMVGPDSLAGKAGVEVGSILTEINGQSTVGIPQQDLMELIKTSPRPLRMRFVLKRTYDLAGQALLPGQHAKHPSTATNSSVLGGEVVDEFRAPMQLNPPRGPPPMSPEAPSPVASSTRSTSSANKRLRQRAAARREEDDVDSVEDNGPAAAAAMRPTMSGSSDDSNSPRQTQRYIRSPRK